MSVEASYFAIVDGRKVSHSEQIADDVIADYGADGTLLGVEFLSASAAAKRDAWIAAASARASVGRLRAPAKPSAAA